MNIYTIETLAACIQGWDINIQQVANGEFFVTLRHPEASDWDEPRNIRERHSSLETALGIAFKERDERLLCFSCEKQPQKYITGLCEECHQICLKADEGLEEKSYK